MNIINTTMAILLSIMIISFLYFSYNELQCSTGGGKDSSRDCPIMLVIMASVMLFILIFIPWFIYFINDLSSNNPGIKNVRSNKSRNNNSQSNNSRNA